MIGQISNKNFNHPAYINVQYFVLKDKNLNLLEKLIFSVFYSFYFSGMPIKMSDAYLAEMISSSDGDYSVRHMKRVINSLEEKGYIKRYKNKKGKRLIQVTKIIQTPIEINDDEDNLYTDADGKVIHISSTKIIPEGHPCPHEGTSMSPEEGHSCHPYNKEDNKKDNKVCDKSQRTQKFDIKKHNPFGLSDETLKGYIEMRKAIKKPLTEHAWNLLTNEIQKAVDLGYTAQQCIDEAILNTWQGFKAEWIQNRYADKTQNKAPRSDYPTTAAQEEQYRKEKQLRAQEEAKAFRNLKEVVHTQTSLSNIAKMRESLK
jgi:hypothetical protein